MGRQNWYSVVATLAALVALAAFAVLTKVIISSRDGELPITLNMAPLVFAGAVVMFAHPVWIVGIMQKQTTKRKIGTIVVVALAFAFAVYAGEILIVRFVG